MLQWAERHSLPISATMRPELARALHDGAVSRLDGNLSLVPSRVNGA